ncbi:MAG: HAMP domain-containing histidine kinase [Oscillospiraceae bacterium]|nr:HAMP domain-containing histidine kinase [Oscillospiraceae bacterium]
MIRTLQKRFVLTAMTAVTLLLLVLLGALNIFNAISSTRQADRILENLGMQANPSEQVDPMRADNEPMPPLSSGSLPEGGPSLPSLQPSGPQPGPAEGFPPAALNRSEGMRHFLDEPFNENTRMAAVYFLAELDQEGAVTAVDTTRIASLSDEEAVTIAASLVPAHTRGSILGFRYLVLAKPEGGSRVVFLDMEQRNASVTRVLLLSLLLGIACWLLMLLLILALSRRAILPIAENIQRQKQFVTDAGHDLKTPLAVILANVDAMEMTGHESKYSRNIRTQAQHLTALTQDMLNLARMDELHLASNPVDLDFSALCSQAFSSFRESALLRGLRYEMNCAPGIMLRGDSALLAQLCSILGDNAVKYCADNGLIRITLHREGRECCLHVSNSVTEPPDTAHIFDRFYRSDKARTRQGGGFGIGLSAAQEICRLHRGNISAQFREDSSVLMFSVTLPVK